MSQPDRSFNQAISRDIAFAATREFKSPQDVVTRGIHINPDIIGIRWGEKAMTDYISAQAAKIRAENNAHPAFRRSSAMPGATGR